MPNFSDYVKLNVIKRKLEVIGKEHGMADRSKMKITVKNHADDSCYRIWWHIDDREYQFAKDYFYSNETEKHSMWKLCLEHAVTYEGYLDRCFKERQDKKEF